MSSTTVPHGNKSTPPSPLSAPASDVDAEAYAQLLEQVETQWRAIEAKTDQLRSQMLQQQQSSTTTTTNNNNNNNESEIDDYWFSPAPKTSPDCSSSRPPRRSEVRRVVADVLSVYIDVTRAVLENKVTSPSPSAGKRQSEVDDDDYGCSRRDVSDEPCDLSRLMVSLREVVSKHDAVLESLVVAVRGGAVTAGDGGMIGDGGKLLLLVGRGIEFVCERAIGFRCIVVALAVGLVSYLLAV